MDSNTPSVSAASPPGSSVFGAFGAVLGYVGGEAPLQSLFSRLLWPQRYYSGFTFSHIPKLALLLPMGGPLQKAALQTLDVLFSHSLLKGPQQGHMLGTAFFRDEGWQYTLHGPNGHREELRNCVWVRALRHLEIPMLDMTATPPNMQTAEKGNIKNEKYRAKVSVAHLTITPARDTDRKPAIPCLSEDTGIPGLRVFMAIVATELTGILTAVGIAWLLQSWWSFLWIVPLVLRLLSAACALNREPLISPSSSAASDPLQDFEIHCPSLTGSFMLITGPPTLVLQFFRHYGHPVRNRARELVQILVIILYGSLFPVGLLCSVLWMPVTIQYVWLCYQIYAVLAMYVARYTSSDIWASTEESIARALSSDSGPTYMLFGREEGSAGNFKVRLNVTYHHRYQTGKEHMERLLVRPGGSGS